MTPEEWKVIRKALQIVQMAHMITDTADSIPYRDTIIDSLIRKARRLEEGLTEEETDGTIKKPDYEQGCSE